MMMALRFVLVLICLISIIKCQEHEPLEAFLDTFPNAYSDPVGLSSVLKQQSQSRIPPPSEPEPSFEACPKLPKAPDTDDVNKLRPGNIKLLMAMGDSITAGMSAKDTLLVSLKEYRGLCYSIGSDSGLTTMPNLLQSVSTNTIYGTSTGIGKRDILTNGYNAGVSGARNKDMYGQAEWLVAKLKSDTKLNATDWKMLTIWIGSNNLCDVCNDDAANNAKNFQTELVRTFEYLYANVQRLFINLLANLDVARLYNINSGACGTLHNIECPCAGSSDSSKRAKASQAAAEYQAMAFTIAQSFTGRRKDFAVVVQPFLQNSIIVDRSLLSTADCFHPSASCHANISIALWNNMITPAAQKLTKWTPGEVPICPTADTLLYTN